MQRSFSIVSIVLTLLLCYWIETTTSSSPLLLFLARRCRGQFLGEVMRRRRSPSEPSMSTTTTTPSSIEGISLPTESRVIYFGGFGAPAYERVEPLKLPPDRNHLLVQVHAVGLNPVDAKGVIGDKLGHNERKTLR